METTTTIPGACVHGDTLNILIPGGEYSATEYSLTATFISAGGKAAFTAEASGTDHLLTVESEQLPTGRNDWQLKVTGPGFSRVIKAGVLMVAADFAAEGIGTLDNRTWLDLAIEALQAAIRGLAGKTQLTMEVNQVRIERMSLAEKIDALKNLQRLKAAGADTTQGISRRRWQTIKPRFEN